MRSGAPDEGRPAHRHRRVILADEATASLDTDRGRAVVNLLRRLGRERRSAVIVVTHDERMIEGFDRVFHMVDGRIIATVAEVPEKETTRSMPAGEEWRVGQPALPFWRVTAAEKLLQLQTAQEGLRSDLSAPNLLFASREADAMGAQLCHRQDLRPLGRGLLVVGRCPQGSWWGPCSLGAG